MTQVTFSPTEQTLPITVSFVLKTMTLSNKQVSCDVRSSRSISRTFIGQPSDRDWILGFTSPYRQGSRILCLDHGSGPF